MQTVIPMIFVGVTTGIILSYTYNQLTNNTDKNSEEDSGSNTESESVDSRAENGLKVCSNCGTYNEQYSKYCQNCVSGIQGSRTTKPEEMSGEPS